MAQPYSQNIAEVEARPLAHFSPSIWGNYFEKLSFNSMEKETYAMKVESLIGEVKTMLVASTSIPIETIKLIDLMSRLGVSYHFEKDIEKRLETLFSSYMLIVNAIGDDLNNIALLFRVFRQNGYYMSSDVFCKFKDNDGNFKEELTQDLKGILSLYEAARLSVHGENILDEALKFTTIHLKAISTQSSHPLVKQVKHCLDYPIQRSIPRVEARHFISIYEQDESHNKILLELAKADFNLVQILHRQELSEITRWHKDIAAKLTYARDRAVELYFWIMSVYFEPHFSRARLIASKLGLLLANFDDTYDAYGTPTELNELTNAVKRWNMDAVDELPDYMKILYKALLELFDELYQEMSTEGNDHVVNSGKDQVISLICAYNEEANWCKERYMPKLDEYLVIANKTSMQSYLAICFIGMRGSAGSEAMEWLNTCPKIIKAGNTVGRLLDDIRSHKFEQERRHVFSAMECYMKEHRVEEEEAVEELNKIVEDKWKDINEDCMRPTAISNNILLKALNFTRASDFIYKYTDGFTDAEALKDTIASLYVDKIPM